MPNVPITFACGLYDRMQALYTGEVKPEGIDLNFLAIDDPRQIFDRMGKNQEFDASEMSSSDTITRHAAGRREMVALPVFPSRVFRHGFVTVNRRFVTSPKDLEGKRIGTPIYTQTAAVIIRGMLKDEYGVSFSNCHWVQGATNSAGTHGSPSPLPQLPGVSIEQNSSGLSLSDLLARGDIQAIIGSGLPQSLKTSPDVRRLFPDFHAVEMASYRRTRVFPIMHLVAMRRDVYERNPFIAKSLYCLARLSGTMPLGAASRTSAAVCGAASRSIQPIQAKIRDRRNVNQNFRHHHEQDGEQQQLSGKADARLPRRPQHVLDCNWFAGRVQNHLSRTIRIHPMMRRTQLPVKLGHNSLSQHAYRILTASDMARQYRRKNGCSAPVRLRAPGIPINSPACAPAIVAPTILPFGGVMILM